MRRRQLHGIRHKNCQPRSRTRQLQTTAQTRKRQSICQTQRLLKPAVKEVIVGVGDKAKKIGGKLVMYRHEFTYKNPTAIAIDVTDEMTEQEIVSRVQKTDNFTFEYIGNTLKLDMIAVRCTSGDADKFKATVKKVSETTKLPMILCTLSPAIAEAGLMAAPKARPLLTQQTQPTGKTWQN
jgi:acetyl-CoA decarbonylase/synthase complex subunit gamma